MQQHTVCVRCYDNKVVSLVSSFVGAEPLGKAKRWDKKLKKYVEINKPTILNEYNKFMGGIDLLNMCTNKYKYGQNIKETDALFSPYLVGCTKVSLRRKG